MSCISWYARSFILVSIIWSCILLYGLVLFSKVFYGLELAGAVPVGLHSGGRVAMTLLAIKKVIINFFPIFFHFFSVATFSHRTSGLIKKLI